VNQHLIKAGFICPLIILSIYFSKGSFAQDLQGRFNSQQNYRQLENELKIKEDEAIRKSQVQAPYYDCGFWGKFSFVDGFVISRREQSLGKFVNKNGSYSFSWSWRDTFDNSSMVEEAEFNPQTKIIYVVHRPSNPRRYSGEVMADKCKQIGG
jgi:hypothetical protein